MAEAGFKSMLSSAWVGIFVASSTPSGLALQIEMCGNNRHWRMLGHGLRQRLRAGV